MVDEVACGAEVGLVVEVEGEGGGGGGDADEGGEEGDVGVVLVGGGEADGGCELRGGEGGEEEGEEGGAGEHGGLVLLFRFLVLVMNVWVECGRVFVCMYVCCICILALCCVVVFIVLVLSRR